MPSDEPSDTHFLCRDCGCEVFCFVSPPPEQEDRCVECWWFDKWKIPRRPALEPGAADHA